MKVLGNRICDDRMHSSILLAKFCTLIAPWFDLVVAIYSLTITGPPP